MKNLISALRISIIGSPGIECGFTTEADLLEFSHVIRIHGLTPWWRDYGRFRAVFHFCKNAAIGVAPFAHRCAAFYIDHQRAGYDFRFADLATAQQFRTAIETRCSLWGCVIQGDQNHGA